MMHTGVGVAAVLALALAAGGATPPAVDERCIPGDGVAPRSNTGGIFARRALSAGCIARLDAPRDLHHGLPAQAPPRPQVDFKGRLYRAVFVPGPDTLSSGDLAQVAEPLRGRLGTFLTRRSNFTSHYESAPQDLVAAEADARRRAIERAIVSLIDAKGIEERAVSFVSAAPILYEWEGAPDGPLRESAYAEHILEIEPSTPLAPFLYLFIAHRQRAASEAAGRAQNAAVAQAAAVKATAFLLKARAVSDPIFGLIADDLERVPFVYVRQKAGAA